jgi:hypothetical protein
MQSSQDKSSRGVVKRCGCEAHGRVAIRAVSHRESGPGSGVRRGGGPLPAAAIVCVQVASGISAIGRSDLQGIVATDVAQGTGHVGVAVGQIETKRAVVKRSSSPSRNGVAGSALRRGGRETRGDVIRHIAANRLGAHEIVQVAIRGVAIGCLKGIRGGAVVAGSTRRRRRGHVRSDQRKPGHTVIERGAGPTCRGMAIGAICHGKLSGGGSVRRRGGLLPGRQMALRIPAIRRFDLQREVAADMAQGAGHIGVTQGQVETKRAVVKDSGRPGRNGVAGSALRGGRRETGRDVVRHRAANRLGSQEIVQVAIRGVAVGVIQGVGVGAGMAGSARRRRRRQVRSGQGEPSHAVIERRSRPARCRMAIGTVRCRECRSG